MVEILNKMNKIKGNEMDSNKTTTALKLTQEGCCCLTDTEKKELAAQLRKAVGLSKWLWKSAAS